MDDNKKSCPKCGFVDIYIEPEGRGVQVRRQIRNGLGVPVVRHHVSGRGSNTRKSKGGVSTWSHLLWSCMTWHASLKRAAADVRSSLIIEPMPV